MKFILSIFALLTIVFIVGCSAKDSNDKLSSSEIRKLGKKYGGVYVFNKEFEKEIDERERQRKELKDCYESKTKTQCEQVIKKQITTNGYFLNMVWNNNKNKFMKKYNSNDENVALDRYISHIADKKIYPIQTLSNGKKYYTRTRDYGNDYKKAVSLSKKYIDRIINFIGQENWNKHIPTLYTGYFYVDNDEVVPIRLSVTYSYQVTKYGLFGDEGRGFSLSRDEIYTVRGGNKFYLEDLEDK